MAGQNLDTKKLAADVERLNLWMVAVIIVLLIGLAAMFATVGALAVSHFDTSTAAFQALQNKVDQQNQEINLLIYQNEHGK